MRRAIDALRSDQTALIDGVKIFMNGSWVLLLPDPDEATFHIWVEAPNKTEARTLMKEYSEKLREWQKT
jgi:mannose-1-phosphate guanylyltransferase/phosphomannomutase